MAFIPEKDTGLIPKMLTQILDTCVNGITLSDPDQPDNPIVFANKVFEDMSGYPQEEIIGRNCRFLHGDDRDQPGLESIREAMRTESRVEVVLRNYRRSGEMFHNQLTVQPLHDENGQLIYYLGVQYDITPIVTAREEADRMAALFNRPDEA
ncbi:PAS domain-containing protein [Spiribacter sp. 1M153]|uniref:PAS domain-containing protein n=1 Tax=Spiribacter roseus TaxID=1855875 RepID=UPI00349F8DD7